MLKFAVLLSAVVCALGAVVPMGLFPQLDGRIIGGKATKIEAVPYQISLQRSGFHVCGGSIYNSVTIITAAHCLTYVTASVLKVRAGSTYWNSGGKLKKVALIRRHQNYRPLTMLNDIAVIKLASPLIFSPSIKIIRLASAVPPNGAVAVVSGWGRTKSGAFSSPIHLRSVDVNIIHRKVCMSSTYGYGSEVKPGMICASAYYKDSCQGDSGGPLASGNVLIGVVSWGHGCAHPKFPGVYTSIPYYKYWLHKNI